MTFAFVELFGYGASASSARMPWLATASVNVAQSVAGSVSCPVIETAAWLPFSVKVMFALQLPLFGDLIVTDAALVTSGSCDGCDGENEGVAETLTFDAIVLPSEPFTWIALVDDGKVPLTVSAVGRPPPPELDEELELDDVDEDDELEPAGHSASNDSALASSSQLFPSKQESCASVSVLPQSWPQPCVTTLLGAWHDVIFV